MDNTRADQTVTRASEEAAELFWISVAIAVAGALAGKVLQLLGFGVPADGHH